MKLQQLQFFYIKLSVSTVGHICDIRRQLFDICFDVYFYKYYVSYWTAFVHGKNDFAEGSKILLDIDLKIILLDH